MRLLILGGTMFLGRAVAEDALARGHELTLFNRGETNPGLFPEAEHLRGDRGATSRRSRAHVGRRDRPSGYVPAAVRASAELLRDRPLRLRLERLGLRRLLDRSDRVQPTAELGRCRSTRSRPTTPTTAR